MKEKEESIDSKQPIIGEDIGFEENMNMKENDQRTHARLLNGLLSEILSGGKYVEWFWGINQITTTTNDEK